LSGSLGVAVKPSDVVTVYGNIGTSFEPPTTRVLTNWPSGAGGFNPALERQKATNYEIGVRGDVRGRLNYSVALFDAEVRDELIQFPVPADANGRVFYQNAGRSRHRGVELGSELEIAAGLNLVTTWTYSDFRYTRYTLGTQVLDGQALPGIPQHWLHFLLQLRPPALRGGWVEVEETHSSGFTVDDTASTSNAPRTGPWWTTNLRAGWDGTVAVAALVAAPLCGQGSGGAADPLPGAPPHAVVTNDMLLNAAASGDWLMYGHNYWNNRFSPLKTINTTNVKNLVPRAVYTHGASTLGSFETTPIVVAGIMYITSPATPNNIVRAFDLRTQKMLWHYEHKNGPVSTACCGPNNRGVAVSGGSVFVGTLDDYLVALDATTGKVKWEVKVGDGPEAGYTETMAPLVIGDNVIIGTSGAEYGIRG